MTAINKLMDDSIKFKFFREFTLNTSFLLLPLISEIVFYGLGKVFAPIHLLLLSLLLLQTYLLVKIEKLTFVKVFFLNLIGPGIYLLIELVTEGSLFDNSIYILYFLYMFLNAFIRSFKYYFTVKSLYNYSYVINAIYTFSKLSLIPVFYYILNLKGGSTESFLEFYLFGINSTNIFLFFMFLYLAFIYSIDSYLLEKRKKIVDTLLSVLHKYSSWIVDSKDIETSLSNGFVDMSCKKTYKAVIFMDIRGFTSWSENNKPEAVTDMLNGFYRVAEDLIEKYTSGSINKYVADEIVFVFDDLDKAIDFSLELKIIEIKYLAQFDLKVGFGINAGVLIYGWIGGNLKKEQTVIGDTVNIAARLEGGINQIKIPKHIVPNRYKVNTLGNISLKGKAAEMEIVEIISKIS